MTAGTSRSTTTGPGPASVEAFAWAPYAGGIVLTRSGRPGARWLNTVAALLWLAGPEAASEAALACEIAAATGAAADRVARDLADLPASWRADDFFSADEPALRPSPCRGSRAWRIVACLGEQPVRIEVDDPTMAASLAARLEPVDDPGGDLTSVTLVGDGTTWEVRRNDRPVYLGDQAVQARSALLVEAVRASRPGCDVLAWLHAGAVAGPFGAWVLCGSGGRGKSTLTAALVAGGHLLLADDIVPLAAGTLLLSPVRLPVSLRPGGLAALAGRLPAGTSLRDHDHDGEPTRLWQPPDALLAPRDAALPAAALLFPEFTPGAAARAELLGPVAKLEALVASWSSLPRNSPRLAMFAAWLASTPAWRLTYPDLELALRLVELLPRPAEGGQAGRCEVTGLRAA